MEQVRAHYHPFVSFVLAQVSVQFVTGRGTISQITEEVAVAATAAVATATAVVAHIMAVHRGAAAITRQERVPFVEVLVNVHPPVTINIIAVVQENVRLVAGKAIIGMGALS
ncbi:MAG: hypothetical protein J5888_04295 [Bacteroidaceae bacterium]|nr:hypothetical protein [Bacteroidaceae bacterium]